MAPQERQTCACECETGNRPAHALVPELRAAGREQDPEQEGEREGSIFSFASIRQMDQGPVEQCCCPWHGVMPYYGGAQGAQRS